MPEKKSKFREVIPPVHQSDAVLNNARLINGQPAAPVLLERMTDFPIRRVVVFGEPGANKTTLLLQLARAATEQDPTVRPQFLFYDSILAEFRRQTGTIQLSNSDHQKVSDLLTHEMETTFTPNDQSDGTHQVQFVELVGMSLHDRGVSTLRKAAERVKDTSPIEKDTLAIGIVADPRSLKDAGEVRQAIRDLEDPTDVYSMLRKYRIYISQFEGIPYVQMAEKIVEFFRNMAPPHKIEEVHREVMTQARRRTSEDEYRVFKQLKIPRFNFPITETSAKRDYLLSLSFMQMHMEELGLVANALSPEVDHIKDAGITVFSPYNPNIPKVLDLTKVLKATTK